MAKNLSLAKTMLFKRALKANFSFEEIANLFNITLPEITEIIKNNPELKEMANILPAISRLELVEAMQVNATQNQNATIQKFLAKNWNGMKEDVGVSNNNIQIAVVFEDSEKPKYDTKQIEMNQDKSLIDIVIEGEKELEQAK